MSLKGNRIMAKANRTTSTPRRATAAKATLPAIKGKKANPWIDHGNGIRSRRCTMSSAATARMIERNIQRDTLGLGYWREPSDWCTEPFSHTVTTVCDATGQQGGWLLYNSGVVLTLAVHPIEGPFVRGVPYVWCKAAHDRNGNSGVYPTSPLFGRFMSQTKRGPKVLSGRGKSAVLGAEYVYCFRPVGRIGCDAALYTRSEIPVPIPTAAEWDEQPEEFEVLQHHVKALDQLLSNMADIDDMVDDLEDAAKKAGKADDWQAAACRQARAFKALQPILTAAIQQHDQLEGQLAAFLASAPKLAMRLAHLQADDTARAT
jgi:hypothetical protein